MLRMAVPPNERGAPRAASLRRVPVQSRVVGSSPGGNRPALTGGSRSVIAPLLRWAPIRCSALNWRRVSGIAQPVPDEVERQHGDDDDEHAGDHQPRRQRQRVNVLRRLPQHALADGRCLDAQPEKAEDGLGQDHVRYRQCKVDDETTRHRTPPPARQPGPAIEPGSEIQTVALTPWL